MAQERVIGLLVLILLLFTCFFFALSADSQVFNPLNTVRPITQTWRAQQTGTPRLTLPPRTTPTSRFGGDAVENLPILHDMHTSNDGDLRNATSDHLLWLTLGNCSRLRARCAHRTAPVGERHNCQ
jgi:hypothetical protein